ncbi:hypothetical protein KIKIMORA_04020 [Brevundimonas phage vB_BpoS-Kikimora]|uniref:Uncharacterized protein n=1 Tax=Brevundimonas phage vB_BpoS-Kikimora TaxID=2948601 RepID=A0A9E7SL17_9CAUD|nr:hypothetical protein KIKIMORA_04020 [Brevundimonas phage vB_BpoS-Kikimora]
MAILDSEKLDFLWKRIIFGVSKTAGALVKFGSNETIASALPVLPSQVWSDGDTIPATPAPSTIVAAHVGAERIRATSDPTSPVNQAWLATATFDDVGTRLTRFIAPTFGSGYAVKVYIGDPNTGPAARIFPDTTDEEWVFDYQAGVLIFTGTIPSGKPATVGTGTVSVATDGVYLELYRYIGATGTGGGGGPGGDLGTMALQDADNVDITGGTIRNVTLYDITIDAGEF